MEAHINGLTLEETRYAVKATRLEKGWSQQKLADKIGISRSLLAKFENGSRKLSDEKIEQLLNCLLSKEKNEHLEGIVDYLTIHFFSIDYKILIDKVLNISMNHMVFHETKILGYIGRYNLLKAIDIRISGDEKKGTLFELKGTGCRYLAGWLKGKKHGMIFLSEFLNMAEFSHE